ncbi:hypothetical protein [Streptomyces sp. ML-6]|nr:hypothetical protein [Streptomyces sp. ML-6]MDK0519686.1 hypothetical protein [Streptomyces sp. ML-6]
MLRVFRETAPPCGYATIAREALDGSSTTTRMVEAASRGGGDAGGDG